MTFLFRLRDSPGGDLFGWSRPTLPLPLIALYSTAAQVYMYSMSQTLSSVPYSGAKGMLKTIFGLDHLGDDAAGIKKALVKVRSTA